MESLSDAELRVVLGVGPDSDGQALRAAYLAKVREHPPERDPEGFERVRDAYQTLTDPKRRMRRWFDDEALKRPLRDLLDESGDCEGRAFLGVALWREFLAHCKRNAKGKPS